jgi:hypothetical protein
MQSADLRITRQHGVHDVIECCLEAATLAADS